ncbi:MAG: DUF1127 domain-containing protein [Desulfuromusa sp.]|nr:DUF1127 domain-containing protein [Desulfuromusa sp.]
MMLFRLVNKVLDKILFWRELSVERAELSRVSDDLLTDIGLSREVAVHEANRHFWDAATVEGESERTCLHINLHL